MNDVSALAERFSKIYTEKEWGGGSGTGALISKNIPYITFLQNFMERNDIYTVVDFGCGDWQFSRHIDWTGIKYIGVDIVESVVHRNQENFGTDNISFQIAHNLEAMPRADLLVSKDVFQHLPNAVVSSYLRQFLTRYKLILITNDDYPNGGLNRDINPGDWRPIRLDKTPFLEPAAVVFSWIVEARWGLTRKVTQLLYGDGV